MGKQTLKVGLLGCGGIAVAHVRGFDKVKEECEVVAVAEPDKARHKQIRQWFGSDVTIVDDYQDVLNIDEIRAVDVLLPLPILGEYSPDLPLSVEDHKCLFGAEIFESWWHDEQPDLTREELSMTIGSPGRNGG